MNNDRRELLKTICAAGAALPFVSPGSVLAQTGDAAILAAVHPELRTIAAGILKATAQMPTFSLETLPALRKGSPFTRPRRGDVPVQRRLIPGHSNQPDVAIIVINAKSGENRPVLLHMHGGGYFLGKADEGVSVLQNLCTELNCAAVTVDYRLAPEAIWTASLEDNYTALKWLHDNARTLGADPGRIAVMGESAGGGHATLLAITARDRGEVPIAFQCLTYPMIDDHTGSTRSVPDHVGKIIWKAENNRFGWECFLGMKPGGRRVPAKAVPARVENLAGLPPAWIGVGSIDLFHDEDVDYAQRLNAAKVPTELIVVPGAFHGFDSIPMAVPPIVRWFNEARVDALRRGLGIPVA
jgi:acetyl esterase/lipase